MGVFETLEEPLDFLDRGTATVPARMPAEVRGLVIIAVPVGSGVVNGWKESGLAGRRSAGAGSAVQRGVEVTDRADVDVAGAIGEDGLAAADEQGGTISLDEAVK